MKSEFIKAYEQKTGIDFTDRVTGLFNQDFFEMAISRDFDRSDRYGEPLSLVLIHVDSPTNLNEDTDPELKDRILKEISELIVKNIRDVDLAAKYTDGLFSVLLMKADKHIAQNTLERIRDAVKKQYSGTTTISGGLASFPKDAKTIKALTVHAHNSLVLAKNTKNAVVHVSGPPLSLSEEQSRILVVDDDPDNVKLLETLLMQFNHQVVSAFNGEQALSVINTTEVDLVLLDVMMPEMDGFKVCRKIKTNDATRLIPVILVTALNSIDDKIKGMEAGADHFLTKPINNVELFASVKSLVKLRNLNRDLTSMEDLLFSLANAVEAKDTYTQGHVERVSNLAMTLGRKMGLSVGECRALKYGGALHDIGKIAVPRDIINKPGKLDPEEWEIMKRHPDIGHRICMPLKNSLGPALDAIRYHHEKLNGTGYPEGLKEDSISLIARIMAVVDIFDALTTERPYRKGMLYDDAFKVLRKEAENGELDPNVVETFETIFARRDSENE